MKKQKSKISKILIAVVLFITMAATIHKIYNEPELLKDQEIQTELIENIENFTESVEEIISEEPLPE